MSYETARWSRCGDTAAWTMGNSREADSRKGMNCNDHIGLAVPKSMARIVARLRRDSGRIVARLTARIWRERTYTNLLVGLHLRGIQRLLHPCFLGSDCDRGYYWARCEVMALLQGWLQR